MSFQSTRPIRGATAVLVSEAVFEDISIHAPHTGRDAPAGAVVCIEVISIHAPHTGRDTPRTFSAFIPALFQSTRPIRGATAQSIITTSAPTNFNPRAPYGARPGRQDRMRHTQPHFNPRAPYGARLGLKPCKIICIYFNPRAPYGARLAWTTQERPPWYFNPRAPYGARPLFGL